MKKTRFSEEQMVTILREANQRPVPEVAKKNGVSAQTLYAWRKHFGTLEPADVKRLRQLEQENGRLKKMVADRDLEIDVLKEITRKNGRRTRASRPRDRITAELTYELVQSLGAGQFNGKFRDEYLSLQWFRNRVDAKVGIEQWRRHYNDVRPHLSLGYLTPAEFKAQLRAGSDDGGRSPAMPAHADQEEHESDLTMPTGAVLQ